MCGLCFQHVNTYMRARVRGLPAPASYSGRGSLFISHPDSYFFDGAQGEHPRRKEPCAEKINHAFGVLQRRGGDPGLPHSLAGKLVSLGMTGLQLP